MDRAADSARPGAGAFDDATWTGSVMRHGGRRQMLDSGIARAEDGGGAADRPRGRPTNLVRRERHGAVLEADPRWYETLDPGAPEAATPASSATRCRSGPPDGTLSLGPAMSDAGRS